MKSYMFLFSISFIVGFLLISATQAEATFKLTDFNLCKILKKCPTATPTVSVTPTVEPTASVSAVPTTSVPLTAPMQTITNNNNTTTEKITEKTVEVRIPQAPPTTGRARM